MYFSHIISTEIPESIEMISLNLFPHSNKHSVDALSDVHSQPVSMNFARITSEIYFKSLSNTVSRVKKVSK